MDSIFINDLKVKCIIGTLPEERSIKQPLIINAEMFLPLREAGCGGGLAASVNYAEVEEMLVKRSSESSYFLLEELAEELAEAVLEYDCRISSVRLEIHKMLASAFHADIGIKIEREQKKH